MNQWEFLVFQTRYDRTAAQSFSKANRLLIRQAKPAKYESNWSRGPNALLLQRRHIAGMHFQSESLTLMVSHLPIFA